MAFAGDVWDFLRSMSAFLTYLVLLKMTFFLCAARGHSRVSGEWWNCGSRGLQLLATPPLLPLTTARWQLTPAETPLVCANCNDWLQPPRSSWCLSVISTPADNGTGHESRPAMELIRTGVNEFFLDEIRCLVNCLNQNRLQQSTQRISKLKLIYIIFCTR